MYRTLIVGDIHGSLESLEGVLKLAKYNPERDRLICLGDYVDGWGKSYEVVDKLIEYQEGSPYENIYLLGNHDFYFIQVLRDGLKLFRNLKYVSEVNDDWWKQGGESTYYSYLKRTDAEIKRHAQKFYDDLRYYHIENNMLFVHAGFNPRLGFLASFTANKEEVLWNRTVHRLAFNMDDINFKIGAYDKIFIGHTPTLFDIGIHPRQYCNVVNLDQGCKTSKRLTAWELDSGRWYQYKSEK